MNATTAIVLAVGAVGAAVFVLRRKAQEEGVSLCTKLGAIDGQAGTACSILGALGIDAGTVGKFAGGLKSTPSFVGHAVTGSIESARDAVGLGGDGDPCTGTYGLLGFRSLDCCQRWVRAGKPNPNQWQAATGCGR